MVGPQIAKTPDNFPLHLEDHLLERKIAIESWFRHQWAIHSPLFYSSADLRHAGFKISPVDTNLFPAGFNNLNPSSIPLAIHAVQSLLRENHPHIESLLLVPENHTRNMGYLDNLVSLQTILTNAGLDVRIGSLIEQLKQAKTIRLSSGRELTLEPIKIENNRIGVEGFFPNHILLNNDFSGNIPDIFKHTDQTILPKLSMSWAHRLKSQHFNRYDTVCQTFSQAFELDSWLISPLFAACEDVSFDRNDNPTLIEKADQLLADIAKKYQTYQINEKPFIVIKADAGTYGMGVMMVQDPNELSTLNRKQRQHMATSKGGKPNHKVIIQEGVYSFENWQGATAEPVVYSIGPQVIGGFYRIHQKRSPTENLNAPGMTFEPLAFSNACNNPDHAVNHTAACNRLYAYGVIARLAALAAAMEAEHD